MEERGALRSTSWALTLAMMFICLPGAWIVISAMRPLTVEIMASRRSGSPTSFSLQAFISMFGIVGQGGVPCSTISGNSLIISLSSTFIAIAIGMSGGYAFARFRFRGKSAIFLGLLLTRTVPGISLSLPAVSSSTARLGVLDTHGALILTLCRAQRTVLHLV